MSNDIYLIGEVGWEITLESVIKSVTESDKTKDLNVHIHSMGGGVYDGLAIYNYLKGLNQTVHTTSSGLVASIATVFFLAGKKETRTINKTDSFLIHLPMGGVQGNAEDFEKHAKELRDIENKIADIYVKETDISKDEVIELMKKDEMLDVDFLKEKGFVSEIKDFKAVATLNNKNKMSDKLTEEKVQSMFNTMTESLKNIFKSKVVNKLVSSADGEVEIDFPDVGEDDTPAIGDKALIDGDDANTSVLMPSGETWVFVEGELSEIVEASTEDNKELEDANAKIKELEDKLSASNKLVLSKDKDIDSIKNSVKDVEKDFKTFKKKITSGFTPNKKKKGNEQKGEEEGRSLYNKK